MNQFLFCLIFAAVQVIAEPQTMEERCRAKLKLALETLYGDSIRAAVAGKDGDLEPHPFYVYEDALKAFNDSHYRFRYKRGTAQQFFDLVVRRMHDPSCEDYATKTLSALFRD